MDEDAATSGTARNGVDGEGARKGRAKAPRPLPAGKGGVNMASDQSVEGGAPAPGGSALAAFQFQGKAVGTVVLNGQIMFSANDVCAVLGLANPRQAIKPLDEDQRGVHVMDTPGGAQEVNVISESGVYALAFRSEKPEARRFGRWVTEEVLPAIRRTGRYEASSAPPPLPPASDPAQALPWELPPVGRFIVTRVRGRPDHVYETSFPDVELTAHVLDVQLLCYAIKSIENHWSRVHLLDSVRENGPPERVCPDVNRAILDAGHLAQRYLTGARGAVYAAT